MKNEFKLYGGLFQGSFGQIYSRLTWQLPQTLLGVAFSRGRSIHENTFHNGVEIDYYKGATFVYGPGKGHSGITLGSYINIWDNTLNYNELTGHYKFDIISAGLYMHEYGHYIQSKWSGPFYLPIFGIPSLMSEIIDKENHRYFYTETCANRLAAKFWDCNEEQWYKISNYGRQTSEIIFHPFHKKKYYNFTE